MPIEEWKSVYDRLLDDDNGQMQIVLKVYCPRSGDTKIKNVGNRETIKLWGISIGTKDGKWETFRAESSGEPAIVIREEVSAEYKVDKALNQ